MFRVLIRLCVLTTITAVVLIASARVLGEQRERHWVAFTAKQHPHSNSTIVVVDVPLNFKWRISHLGYKPNECSQFVPAWSTDGRLAFVNFCLFGSGSIEILDFKTAQLSVMSEAEVVNPAWSADGRVAFIVEIPEYRHIQIYDLAARELEVIHKIALRQPLYWSVDGRLAFLAPAQTTDITESVLLIRDVDGSVDQVGLPLANMEIVGWSPNGAYLAYQYLSSDGGFIHILKAATGEVIDTLSRDDFVVKAWLPDNRLAVLKAGTQAFYALDVGSGDAGEPLDLPLFVHFPQWSSDGQVTFLASNHQGQQAIYVFDGQAKHLRHISSGFQALTFPPVWAQ